MQNLPPLCHPLPYRRDSEHYFQCIRDLPWPVLFDSTQIGHPDNRYDIACAAPLLTLSSLGDNTLVCTSENEQKSLTGDPFILLQDQLSKFPKQRSTDLPFCGGAIGLFSYDLGRQLEPLKSLAKDLEQMPELLIGFYDWAIVTDHQECQCYLASFGLDSNTHKEWPTIIERLSRKPQPSKPMNILSEEIEQSLDREQYQIAFDKIKHYITEGDCYQVNLTKRFEFQANGDPWYVYQKLRYANSAPFSVFFDTPEATILSSSPERLLRLQGRQVETKPIKGTRPRAPDDAKQDSAQAKALQKSIKDRAENLMIVDLLRNDLGKVCSPGSISVPKPFSLESFATVHHLVSTVTGELAPEHNAVSLLKACFPGGSITGAPKRRAMEIIEELEPVRRGAYCGSIGYIGFDGSMDSNILIRTMIYSDNRLRLWAGGGIVNDSDPEQEYRELHDKAQALLSVIAELPRG